MNDPKITVPPIIKDNLCKPEFPEDWTKLPGISPLVPKHAEFDWDAVEVALAAMDAPNGVAELQAQLSDSDRELLANVLGQILRWMLEANRLDLVGLRVAALAWTISPDYFEGGPSARTLAKKFRFSRGKMCKFTGEVRRKFQIQNRAQDHAGNFKP